MGPINKSKLPSIQTAKTDAAVVKKLKSGVAEGAKATSLKAGVEKSAAGLSESRPAKMSQIHARVLGTGPNRYLVQAEGSKAEVQAALQKMLPGISIQLRSLAPKQADAMLSRLTDAQHKAMASLSKSVHSSLSRNAQAYQLQIEGDQRLAAAASKTGVLKFDPQISRVRKPIGGGIGPVGVTVGIGIAGKF